MKKYLSILEKKYTNKSFFNKRGMEMVQVAILVAIAIGLGMLFREKISEFITTTFDSLTNSNF
jgi:hypothetical protein